jgi:hypothetical protein
MTPRPEGHAASSFAIHSFMIFSSRRSYDRLHLFQELPGRHKWRHYRLQHEILWTLRESTPTTDIEIVTFLSAQVSGSMDKC